MKLIEKLKCKLGFHEWKIVATQFDNIFMQYYECIRCGKIEEDKR